MINKSAMGKITLPQKTVAAEEHISISAVNKLPDKESLQQALMDSYDVQQLLHICRGTLYNWRKKGLISFSKVGGRIYFEVADVFLMLKEKKQKKWMVAV